MHFIHWLLMSALH